MLHLLLSQATYSHYYEVSDSDDRTGYDVYDVSGWSFNDQTRQVEYYHGEQQVDPGQSPGEDYSRPTDDEFFVYVSGPTRIGYFHNGQGGVTPVPTTLTLSYQVITATCYGSSTGAIDLTVSGMAGPFAYAWSTGATTQDVGLLKAGSYSVTVTDVPSGAQATQTVAVGQNPRLDVLVRKTENNVRLEVSGGVGPYAYAWDDAPQLTAPERGGLGPGVYRCTITDAAGCTASVDVLIDDNRFYFSGNPITLSLDAGAEYRLDPTTKPGLTFLCEVWLEPVYGSDEFVQVGTVLEQPADREGRTVFQVEELLDAYLDYHLPAVGQAVISPAAPLFRRFYLQYAENYGLVPARDATTVLAQHFVLRGGLSLPEHVAQTYQAAYRPAVRPFLTWQPNDKPTYADQPEFLYYLVDAAPQTFAVSVRLRYADGTTEQRSRGSVTPTSRYEVYCLPAGFQQLGLSDVSAERYVVSWEVWVSNGYGRALTEVRRYLLDRQPVRQRRYLLFANSLGGMDTVALTGEGQLDADVAGDELERAPVPFPDPLLGDQQVLDRTLRPVLKLAGGLRDNSAEWLASAQELLLSRRVLLLAGPRWVPVVVKAKTTPIRKDGETFQTLDVELQLPRDRFYTPRLGATAVTRQDLLLP